MVVGASGLIGCLEFCSLVPIQIVLPHPPYGGVGIFRVTVLPPTQYYKIMNEKCVLVHVELSMKYNRCYMIVDYPIIDNTKGYKTV